MASVGCLGALGVGSRYLKPGKTDHFGFFDCEIQLENAFARPFGTISGRVVINTSNEIKLYGIRVQFDANVNLKFETKVDNRVSSHKKIESVLQDASEPGDGYYIASPVRVQLTGDETDETFIDCNLQPGSYTYPFTLTIPGEPLPSPFKSQYGNLQYKIVAYMRSRYCYVQVAEKPVRFRGYYNLTKLPNVSEPLRHESGFQKSIFSSKKVITAVLTTDRSGVIAGEDLQFKLAIANPKSFTLRKVFVNLVRKVTYNVNGSTKTTLSTLDKFETDEITTDQEITWVGKLTVPKNCIPTYNGKSVYSVINLIQYQIVVAEYPGPLKGKAEVIIGTTNDPEDIIINRRMSVLLVDEPFSRRRERSDSISSRLSDSSVMTTMSLPPPYSQLTSRAVSLMSLETLPPHYDDIK